MVCSRKVLICVIAVLSFSTLSLSQTNGQKTKPNKDSIPALKPPTLPKSSIEEDIDSELDYDPILPLDPMAPRSGLVWAPPSTTYPKTSMSLSPSSKPDYEIEPPTQPDDSPAPNSKPKPSMSPSPSSEPEPEPEPDDGPAPSSKPKPSPSPSQNSKPDFETEPNDGPTPSSKPKLSPSPSSKPKPSMPPSPDSEPNSETEPPAPSSRPKPSPAPGSKPKPVPKPSFAPSESPDDPNSTTGPSPEPKPTIKPAPDPKQGSKSPSQPTPSSPTTKPTFPYQTVNNFCLYKRLSVKRIFCLKVLKNPKAANATEDDYTPLLQVATEATTSYVIKTLKYLKTLYKDKNADPILKPSIRECVIAYQEIAEYIKLVLADASQESAIAGLDGEVIIQDINHCIRAVPKKKNTEIGERNHIAKNYAMLLVDIADNP